jgi:coenzyme F420-0:L-glutamate ligase/coenzyme F420-1:gamma-L-glutamate ligase
MHSYLKTEYNVSNIGVVVTDSRSEPFRYGATGIALGFWGVHPLIDNRGKKDLFGRKIVYSKSDVVDGLAAAATVVSGEVAESIPIVIARDVPNLVFEEGNFEHELMVPPEEDKFRILFEGFKK